MLPAARIASFLELVELIEGSMARQQTPADAIVQHYFRQRRYAGSKDRRFVADCVYRYLRSREELVWGIDHLETVSSARFIALLFLVKEMPDMLASFDEGATYGPDPLTEDELAFMEKAKRLEWEKAPEMVRLNAPAWLAEKFIARYPESAATELSLLNKSAPFDIRVKEPADRFQVMDTLKKLTDNIEKTDYSNLGVRISSPLNIINMPLFTQGSIEVQDEAAQIASLIIKPERGMKILDLCAGAGGKSLAIASLMQNKGEVIALDVSGKRLEECNKRAARGKLSIVKTTRIAEEGDARASTLALHKSGYDRVLVDVPCSGTGTWRRSPDLRWRFNQASLEILNELQLHLLTEGSYCVNDTGLLSYMTCSMLEEENDSIVRRFLRSDAGADWALLDYRSLWAGINAQKMPETCASIRESLQLTPLKHGTDGFYIALFRRNV